MLRAPGQVRCLWFWLKKPIHPLLCTGPFHSHTQTNQRNDKGKNCLAQRPLLISVSYIQKEKISGFSRSFLIHVSLIPHTRVTFVPVSIGSPEDHCAQCGRT